jgi:hypothetical protein
MSGNQYGFIPQKSTIDANMAVKGFVEPALSAGDIVVLINLDVKDAFNAAFWPSILNGLKDYNCSKNFYNLFKSYFSPISAVISANNIVIHKKVTKGAPQGSCSGPGYWNIPYNSILNSPFMKHTKVLPFADHLLLALRSSTTKAAENISSIEMTNITAWAKNNKIKFND